MRSSEVKSSQVKSSDWSQVKTLTSIRSHDKNLPPSCTWTCCWLGPRCRSRCSQSVCEVDFVLTVSSLELSQPRLLHLARYTFLSQTHTHAYSSTHRLNVSNNGQQGPLWNDTYSTAFFPVMFRYVSSVYQSITAPRFLSILLPMYFSILLATNFQNIIIQIIIGMRMEI